MDIFNFDPEKILSLFLTLFRISIVLFLLPFFGGKSLPNAAKGALILVLTLAVWPQLSFPAELFPAHPLGVAIMLLGEALIGFFLGLSVRFMLASVQFAGQIMGFSMGFAMVNVVDPISGVSQAVTAHFLYMTTLLTFLALNGHLYLLGSMADSFRLVPPGQLFITPELGRQILYLGGQIFVMAVRIAAPIIAAVFMVDLSLGLIAKVAPQLHVLLLGFPIKIAVGFFFLGMVLVLVSEYVEDFVAGLGPMLRNLLEALGGGAGVPI